VRQVLTERSPWTAVLVRGGGDEPYDHALWRALAADVGCAGLAVPEKFGGSGASWREAAVVAEEVGRAVAPVPHLGAALATAALLAAADDGQRGDSERASQRASASEERSERGAEQSSVADDPLLASVAAGEATAVLVLALSTPPAAPVPASVRAENAALAGTVTGVADALAADVLVVPTVDGLWAVESSDARLTPLTTLDLTRQLCDVAFDTAPARRLGGPAAVPRAWRAALRVGAALLAAEQVGVASWCLDATVVYLKTRHQFGRPVGSYQGLKHRLADLWVAITQARAVARYAAGCVADDDPDAAVAVALAQAHCSPLAVRAAEECVQMHGGIGFTWEHPAHLYLKRAKSAAIALGTAERHRAALAALVDLPG
ncbi:MAG TPA: acyl-CoA dehydrogenase family protein, partial [Micromonosporaceae bacterium]|nr:acyl-CoA dehydrogenase family protein [Micromonosporaceae bacterium]